MANEKPILFSGEMVRAILEGRKTQTRRLAGLKDVNEHPEWWVRHVVGPLGFKAANRYKGRFGSTFSAERPGEIVVCPALCPYGQPGDRLWVRETWQMNEPPSGAIYRADDIAGHIDRGWRPSIFMPRWASRLILEIVSVRVERLHEISEEDAKAEGAPNNHAVHDVLGFHATIHNVYRRNFAQLWERINGKRNPWASNPWVWVIEFRKAE